MRQLTEGGHIHTRQQTSDAGTQCSSNVRVPGTGQIVPVCLPLVSEANRFLWVYSNQLELPADSVAELMKAFDEFPYLTQDQRVELAQRSSLLEDQVKVWFIAKRIEFGISWDYEDICDVRVKYRSKKKDDEENREGQNWMDEDMRENKRKKKNPEDEEEESGEETGGEEEGTTMVQEVSANVNLERKTKKSRTAKKVKLTRAEDNTNARKKQKLGSKIDKGRKKPVKQGNDNEGDRKLETKMDESENKGQAFPESEGAGFKKKIKKAIKKQMDTVSYNPSEPENPLSRNYFLNPPIQTVNSVALTENQTDPQHSADAPSATTNASFKGKPEALASLQDDLYTEASVSDIFVTDVGKLKELTSIVGLKPAEELGAHASNRNKTRTQLAMLKLAFLYCQYPDSKQYKWLSERTQIPRVDIVQWYGDMRYALKRSKPRWMSDEQFKQTLGNIEFHQYIHKLKKSTDVADHMALMKMLQLCKGSYEKEKKEAPEVKF